MNHLTLDGVMQSLGRPDDDTRGGFSYGGWARPFDDGRTPQPGRWASEWRPGAAWRDGCSDGVLTRTC
jgi:hypothetical protein